MNKLSIGIALITLLCISCNKDDSPITPTQPQGEKMLLIGNSFFKPYANHLEDIANAAGIENHTSINVFRGGDNGRPINFWIDSTSSEHQEIKTALDQGDIQVFGMTAGHDSLDRTEGHRAWINYAVERNPDIDIFIAIPQIDFPNGDPSGSRPDWNTWAIDNGFNSIQELYEYFVQDIVHDSIVDPLRAEFPNTKIFTIPTGWTSLELAQMKQDGQLLDDIDYFGPKATSLFTDQKGHQGQIIEEAGTLLWLRSLYGVDLNTIEFDTGFQTDLHSIAQQIADSHQAEYRR